MEAGKLLIYLRISELVHKNQRDLRIYNHVHVVTGKSGSRGAYITENSCGLPSDGSDSSVKDRTFDWG